MSDKRKERRRQQLWLCGRAPSLQSRGQEFHSRIEIVFFSINDGVELSHNSFTFFTTYNRSLSSVFFIILYS